MYKIYSFTLLMLLLTFRMTAEESPRGAKTKPSTTTLRVGVVQMAQEPELAQNRDKIVRFVSEAADKGCRVVVFPESALSWPDSTRKADIDAAISAIQEAAKRNAIYVILCAIYKRTENDKPFNWLLVVNPSGQIIHRYHKLWSDRRSNDAPGIFQVDGIPCAGIICADRWIRGVEDLPAVGGAKILFELSCNFADEWVAQLGWYWYAPRALRNNVYVIFANTAPNLQVPPDSGMRDRHGHSAIVRPDGTMQIAAGAEPDRLLIATLDLTKASGKEANLRRNHPVFRPFWEVGLTIMGGGSVSVPAFEGYVSPQASITIAAAQMACSRSVADNASKIKTMIQKAKADGADVVAFPELAITGARTDDILAADQAALEAALREIRSAAATERICVVFGMPFLSNGRRQNCAFVLDDRGEIVTRYAQIVVDRPDLFTPSDDARAMWFRVNGVPSVVTIGRREALWSEIAELAAVRGAQMHFHLSYDTDTTTQGALLRRQLWANLASFRTFTATVNAAAPNRLARPSAPANGESAIWDDFRRFRKRTPTGYGTYCAVALARAGSGEQIIYAKQTVERSNAHFRTMTGTTNPQMTDWYEMGAHVIEAGSPLRSASVRR
ncbi:carbon-nitrogen hydrolase family protein [Candidatus Sumerlaeota bacterium]|nr:carbon-nitrogen hydrolase family protein [Candidatus Sumerlaeota bacterium]